jgi:hypothetical protein
MRLEKFMPQEQLKPSANEAEKIYGEKALSPGALAARTLVEEQGKKIEKSMTPIESLGKLMGEIKNMFSPELSPNKVQEAYDKAIEGIGAAKELLDNKDLKDEDRGRAKVYFNYFNSVVEHINLSHEKHLKKKIGHA